MARKIVSDETIADEIIGRLCDEKVRNRWRAFSLSNERPEIGNANKYITECEPELTEWLESLFPYMEQRLNNTLIDDVIKDFFSDEFYREDVVRNKTQLCIQRR
jgi:hypothetical protein